MYDSRHLQADCQEPGSAPRNHTLGNRVWAAFIFFQCGARLQVEFFAKLFLPNIDMVSVEDRDRLLIAALTRNDPPLNHVIRQFHCVPVTPDGTRLRQPTKLVDPGSTVAQLYLPADARFPHGADTYARPEIVDCLRRLGMKRSARDLTWAEVRTAALSSNSIHQRVIERKRNKKQCTINAKILSMCKIIKRSLVCSLQNEL